MFVYLPLLNKIMTPLPTPPTPSTQQHHGYGLLQRIWIWCEAYHRDDQECVDGWMPIRGPFSDILSYHTTQLQSIIHISRWYWMRIRRIISSIWMRWLAVDGIDFPRLMMFINELKWSSYAPITSSSAKLPCHCIVLKSPICLSVDPSVCLTLPDEAKRVDVGGNAWNWKQSGK